MLSMNYCSNIANYGLTECTRRKASWGLQILYCKHLHREVPPSDRKRTRQNGQLFGGHATKHLHRKFRSSSAIPTGYVCSDARDSVHGKAISDPRRREQAPRLRGVILDFLSQLLHVHPDVLHLFGLRGTPNFTQQLTV